MATAEISTIGRRKTMLIYRQDKGLAILQADTRGNQTREIPLRAEDLDAIIEVWPVFREKLISADVPNVGPATDSPNASRASQARANSPLSESQEKLI